MLEIMRAGLCSKKVFPRIRFFPFETTYQKLAKEGVRSIAMQQEGIAHSPYSKAMLAGAEIHPYVHFHDALEQLARALQKAL